MIVIAIVFNLFVDNKWVEFMFTFSCTATVLFLLTDLERKLTERG